MDDAKPAEQETVGILFIYESDGMEWAKYMMNILQNEPYKIQCLSSLCWDLNEELTQKCSVLVLIFTPKMENRVSSLNFDLLQPDSTHSCIIECNGEVSKTDMPKWRTMYTLEETVEIQRAVLTGLIDLYEGVTGNKDNVNVDTDDVLILDVVPAVLYPGQKEVYVIFNYQEKTEVTVSVQGVTARLSTRKCTKTVHVFDMPETCTGEKYVNIFFGDQEDPVFSTNIIIITPENLAESLTFNLRRILCSSDSKEPSTTSEDFYIDPFSKKHCTDATLNKCWLTLKELMRTECKAKKPEVKPTVMTQEETKEKPGVSEPEVSVPEVIEPETATNRVVPRMSKKMNIFKKLFGKMFGNVSTVYTINVGDRKSRRIMMAKCQPIKRFPHLPQKQ